MSKIRGKDTLPEILVRKRLFALGWRYRVCDKRFQGKPDIVIPKAKTIIDVRGCFWHRHGCKDSTMPKLNIAFWMEKWSKNVKRDHRNEAAWRDAEAVKRVATAYLKLLFPHVRTPSDISDAEFSRYCFRPAMKMRYTIKVQMGLMNEQYRGKDLPALKIRKEA